MTNEKMTKEEVVAEAKSLMELHLGTNSGWTFGFHNKKRALGTCYYSTKEIKLSLTYIGRPAHELRTTILHEIAHVLAPGDGHGMIWASHCVRLGIDPSKQGQVSNVSLAERGVKWVLVTPSGEVLKHWFRRPQPQTFAKQGQFYQRSAKGATLGKCVIVPFDSEKHYAS